jgi:cytochrome c peroxidase
MNGLKSLLRRRSALVCFAALALSIAALLSASPSRAGDGKDDGGLFEQAKGLFQPLPKDMATAEFPITAERVRLGRALFFDPRVAVDGSVSCSRCHLPTLYGTDALPMTIGAFGKRLPRNAPTVLNAALYVSEHWDGRFATVEEQAKKSLLGGAFANPDYQSVTARLKAIEGYTPLFRKAFPSDKDPINVDNFALAVGAYERTLVSPSRFDEYLGGKAEALSAQELRGMKTFIETGCADCHKGKGVGGGAYRKFGVESDYWKATGSKSVDKGRFEITKDEADLYKFKVASLRNAAMTPPYFHDGSVGDLPKAVSVMAKVQLDAELTDAEVNDVAAFLGSLTGKLPESFKESPILPAGGFATPVPGGSVEKK